MSMASGGEGSSTSPHKHTNRLAKERSPYLLQHAHNPVDWWGPLNHRFIRDNSWSVIVIHVMLFIVGFHGDKRLLRRQRKKTNPSFYQVMSSSQTRLLACIQFWDFPQGFVCLWPPVGYSTCHWCHVMERESFEDEEIGKILSDNFVCIKLDREERPDVDKVYMTFVQVGPCMCLQLD